MRFTKLSLFIAGAVGILMLGVPRAAHAVAAALVQVTNTASNPVISQSIGNQAAQIVEIECGVVPGSAIDLPGGAYNLGCAAVPATGFIGSLPPQFSQYTVPAGETLVATSLDILSGSAAGSPCMSSAFAQLVTEVPVSGGLGTLQSSARESWIVPSGAGTVHYTYPSGILFSPGTILSFAQNLGSACTVTIDLHGYLTAQ
jgi:hypothetical protein